VVHAAFPHHGEERCLSGWGGSGTIFFSWCNLRCAYCQNWEISWEGEGREVASEELAGLMLGLQGAGCHNVNLVSPSHVVAQVLAAVEIAARRGLSLPLVWNTGGYDSQEALRLLDGVVDVYMPDLKYGDSAVGRRLSRVPDYVEVNRAAVKEMHRQVGDLDLDGRGLARRGLLVRHLVLPAGLAGTEAVMRFLAEEVSPRTWVNLMDQYRPCYRAGEILEMARRPTAADLQEALAAARRGGLERLDPGSGAGREVGIRIAGTLRRPTAPERCRRREVAAQQVVGPDGKVSHWPRARPVVHRSVRPLAELGRRACRSA
jgi:putative pyruvate formate lyase activating enzyme